jgi:FkbM family methyltransferase
VLQSVSVDAEPDLAVIDYLVQPGDSVVDIGANFGVYTKYLSHLVGPQGRVLCFEPVPHTFDILQYNVRKFRLENVHAQRLALSDRAGVVNMEVPHWSDGGENYYQARIVDSPSGSQRQTISIETASLDMAIPDLSAIRFVKCDVEGHELACLMGGRKLLATRQAAWLVEVSSTPSDPGTDAHRLFSMFREHAYTPWYYDRVKLWPYSERTNSVNYFFLQDEHLNKLRSARLL